MAIFHYMNEENLQSPENSEQLDSVGGIVSEPPEQIRKGPSIAVSFFSILAIVLLILLVIVNYLKLTE